MTNNNCQHSFRKNHKNLLFCDWITFTLRRPSLLKNESYQEYIKQIFFKSIFIKEENFKQIDKYKYESKEFGILMSAGKEQFSVQFRGKFFIKKGYLGFYQAINFYKNFQEAVRLPQNKEPLLVTRFDVCQDIEASVEDVLPLYTDENFDFGFTVKSFFSRTEHQSTKLESYKILMNNTSLSVYNKKRELLNNKKDSEKFDCYYELYEDDILLDKEITRIELRTDYRNNNSFFSEMLQNNQKFNEQQICNLYLKKFHQRHKVRISGQQQNKKYWAEEERWHNFFNRELNKVKLSKFEDIKTDEEVKELIKQYLITAMKKNEDVFKYAKKAGEEASKLVLSDIELFNIFKESFKINEFLNLKDFSANKHIKDEELGKAAQFLSSGEEIG